jgi:hypothetical protein
MCYFVQSKSYRQKAGGWLTGAKRRGNLELLFSRYRVSVWADEKVLEKVDGGGSKTE